MPIHLLVTSLGVTMKFTSAIIIFFLAIFAIVAEFILYMIFGVGAALSGDISGVTGIAAFFVGLMIFTIAAGLFAPICALIEFIISKSSDLDALKKKHQNGFKQWFYKDIGTSLYIILLALTFILVIVIMSVVGNAADEALQEADINTAITDNPTINTPETAPNPIDAIPPQETATTARLYTDDDITSAIALAKGMADNIDQKTAFMSNYRLQQNGVQLTLFTPFASAVSLVVNRIEKYDPYTQTDVRNAIELNAVMAYADDIRTKDLYYSWDTSDVRAVIEYDDKICRGSITTLESEIIDFGATYPYATNIAAAFPCFREVRNKTVRIVYILGSQKTTFDVDMTKYK